MKIIRFKAYFLSMMCLIVSQVIAQRNTFSFSYTPAITKLNFDNTDKFNGISGSWQIYFESKDFDMPAYGSNIGFYYNHKFGKISLGIGLLLTELRKQSGLYYQWNGYSSYPDGYAGTNYVMTYKGVELPLVFDYLIKQKNKFSFSVELGVTLNVMVSLTLKDYIVEKKTGYKEGCCTTSINEKNQVFETLKYHINNKNWEYARIGSSIGFKVDYSLFKNLSVSLMPTLKYYSNSLKQADNTFSLKADAFLFGTQLNLNLKF
jgi:hypothetical protein